MPKNKPTGKRFCQHCERELSLELFILRGTKLSKVCKDCELELHLLKHYQNTTQCVSQTAREIIAKYKKEKKEKESFSRPKFAKPKEYKDYFKAPEDRFNEEWQNILKRAKKK